MGSRRRGPVAGPGAGARPSQRLIVTDPTPKWVPGVVLSLASLAILAVLQIDLLFSATTPNGGDMGAHVLGPAILRDQLLPSGRIMGWSDAWFAGFPAFYFYFPLPSLTIVLLDLVLPYGVAFKLVTVAGVAAIPWGGYLLIHALTNSRIVSATAGAAASGFVFLESFSIFGGNIPSTLAGEFSFAWSVAFGLMFLAYAVRATRGEERALAKAAALLAATALSHIIPTMVFVLASLPLLARLGYRKLVPIWLWGFSISAIWALPLAVRIGLTADMEWFPLQGWDEVLPVEIWALLPLAALGGYFILSETWRSSLILVMTLFPVAYYWLIADPGAWVESQSALAFLDAVGKLWNGRVLPFWFLGIALLSGIALGRGIEWSVRRLPKRLPPEWIAVPAAVVAGLVWWRLGTGEVSPTAGALIVSAAAVVVGVGLIWRLRPVWGDQVSVGAAALLAVVASAAAFRSAGLSLWLGLAAAAVVLVVGFAEFRSPLTASALPVFGGLLAISIALSGVSYSAGWARWNYSGYEAKETFGEYEALMETIAGLPPGRVQWEANRELDQYGTPMALMLFPYWSEDHPSMEGLYFESSLTTPFHFLNAATMSASPSNPIPGLTYHTFDFDRGIEQLDLYAVSYYVTFTEQATTAAIEHPRIQLLAESPPFSVFRLPPSEMVEAVTALPVVYERPPGLTADFDDIAFEWYDDPALFDRLVAPNGPEHWPRIASLDELAITFVPQPGGNVTDVIVDNGTISFTTDAVGVPHLVKVSYFANWATDDGDGPYRVTPSLMVVTPTTERVTLEFRNTWAENLGVALTILGLAWFPIRARLRREM